MGSSVQPSPRLGRYRIVKPLKIGGTAAIYLAVMRGEGAFSREVVVKRPLPHLVADQRARLMFVDEAHIASRLSHPNICQVLDLVSREDELYLVLEYLRGVDLREVLKRLLQLGQLMPPEVAVWIAVEICAGLHFAHDALGVDGNPLNIVHRDLSPKNIRITPQGQVKIIDFGIAHALNRATETAAGTIKGTLGYMSPEQILGDVVDRRSDVFAFGIVLFQMLTIRNPFDGASLKERVRKLTQDPIPPVRDFNPALDEEIESIVARCLERDLEDRYQSLNAARIDLERYLSKLQVVSPRQRLIKFLEEIFPRLADPDAELSNVLTEVQNVGGGIDTEQRLVFPDDPPTEERSAPIRPNTAATVQEDPSESPTRAPGPPSSVNDTRPVVNWGEGVTDAAGAGPTRLEQHSPAPKKPLPFGVIGLVLVVVAVVIVSAGIAYNRTGASDVVVAPIDDPPTTARPTGDVPPVTKTAPPVAPPSKRKPPPKRTTRKTTSKRTQLPEARALFRVAIRKSRSGEYGNARLLYHLIYAQSKQRTDASVFYNLGLTYRQSNVAKASACMKACIERNPAGSKAEPAKRVIASLGAVRATTCVSKSEVRAALAQYQRRGSEIDAWLAQ